MSLKLKDYFYDLKSKNSKKDIETTQANEHYDSGNVGKITQAQTKNTQGNKETTKIKNLSQEYIAILTILKEFPMSSLKNIALALRWKKDKVAYYIKKLKVNGYVERVGSSQKGYWKVKV